MNSSQEADKKIINLIGTSLEGLIKDVKISWVNPRITDFEYPFSKSLLGKWQVQVLRIDNKTKFEEIVKLCKQDGYEPATVYHLLNFFKEIENPDRYKKIMAPGSLCVDDFEHPACVVLSNDGVDDIKLGLGNWRGSKISGYDILRVKKIK